MSTIEELLTQGKNQIKESYDKDMKCLLSGSEEEKRDAAKRHVLEVLPLDAQEAVNRSALQTLRQQVEEGSIDGITLDGIKDIDSAPTFSELKQDANTGMHLHDRGFLVQAYKILDERVVKIFYNFFHDDERRKQAAAGQEFVVALTDFIRQTSTNRFVLDALASFKPITPVYNKRNILANMFLDSQDLHEHFRRARNDDKYAHLRETALIDLALHFYAPRFLQSPQGKKWRGRFSQVDHEKLLVEKVLKRCEPAISPEQAVQEILDVLRIDGPVAFSHGDALPANMILKYRTFTPAASKVIGQECTCEYTPIDFEFACLDFPESSIVQRLVKSGVYDARGNCTILLNGKTIEDQLLEDVTEFVKRLDPTAQREDIQKRFATLKAENYLLWAARYRHFANMPKVKNPEEGRILSRYFATVFSHELTKQGKNPSPELLAYLREKFGDPLTYEQLQTVFDAYDPHSCVASLLKTSVPLNAEKKLEELVKTYNRGRLRRKIVAAVAAGVLISVGVAAGITYERKAATLREEVARQEKIVGYQKKIKAIRLYQSNASARELTELTWLREIPIWQGKFDDQQTAYAAFLDYESVYLAIQKAGGKKDFASIQSHLPTDLYYAILDTQYSLDSWMLHDGSGMRPTEARHERIEQKMRETEQKYNAQRAIVR